MIGARQQLSACEAYLYYWLTNCSSVVALELLLLLYANDFLCIYIAYLVIISSIHNILQDVVVLYGSKTLKVSMILSHVTQYRGKGLMLTGYFRVQFTEYYYALG